MLGAILTIAVLVAIEAFGYLLCWKAGEADDRAEQEQIERLNRKEEHNLYLLTVPPTSIKEVNKALTRIMASKGIPYTNLIVGFKLAKATNANGINYATVVVDKRGILPPAVAQTAKAMRQEIKAKYKEIAITMDDYSTSASSNTMAADESALDVQVSDTEFTDVTDKDKDLPFV